MSAVADDYGMESLSNAELIALLARLDGEQCHLSELCVVLHIKIEKLQARSDDTSELAAELESTLSKEREISGRSRELHRKIEELRIERSRRLSSLRRPSLTVVR
jgi:hypothetical protein